MDKVSCASYHAPGANGGEERGGASQGCVGGPLPDKATLFPEKGQKSICLQTETMLNKSMRIKTAEFFKTEFVTISDIFSFFPDFFPQFNLSKFQPHLQLKL